MTKTLEIIDNRIVRLKEYKPTHLDLYVSRKQGRFIFVVKFLVGFSANQDIKMTEAINKPMYGVWIPGKGWVRGKDNQAYADYNKAVAQELAKRLGNNAKVYFIDEALIDLEPILLREESYKSYSIVMRLFGVKKQQQGE